MAGDLLERSWFAVRSILAHPLVRGLLLIAVVFLSRRPRPERPQRDDRIVIRATTEDSVPGVGVRPRGRAVEGVVEYLFDSTAFDRAPQMVLEETPLAIVGGSHGDPAYDLTYASPVLVLRDGRLVVGDRFTTRLMLFRADGRPQRVIAHGGQGPGDVGTLSDVGLLRGDSLVVADMPNAHLKWFTPDRGIARSLRVDQPYAFFADRALGTLPGDRIVVHSGGTHRGGEVRSEPWHIETTVAVIDSIGRTRKIATVEDGLMVPSEMRFRTGERQRVANFTRLGPHASLVMWDTLIVSTTAATPRIEARNGYGRLVFAITNTMRRTPVTAAMRTTSIQRELAMRRGLSSGEVSLVDAAEVERQITEAPYADSLPSYFKLFVTPNKTLWVVDGLTPSDTTWTATAYNSDRIMIGRLRGGFGMPMAFGDDRVVVRATNEDGVVSLPIHRIVKNVRAR